MSCSCNEFITTNDKEVGMFQDRIRQIRSFGQWVVGVSITPQRKTRDWGTRKGAWKK